MTNWVRIATAYMGAGLVTEYDWSPCKNRNETEGRGEKTEEESCLSLRKQSFEQEMPRVPFCFCYGVLSVEERGEKAKRKRREGNRTLIFLVLRGGAWF